MTFNFKIQGITQPPAWRIVAVSSNFTFYKFYKVIQTAFGWDDDHMFEFMDKEYPGNIHISVPAKGNFFDTDIFDGIRNASRIKYRDADAFDINRVNSRLKQI
jgi:hypothetical protein